MPLSAIKCIFNCKTTPHTTAGIKPVNCWDVGERAS